MGLMFETTTINGMELKNRFVRSATWEGMATDEGAVTPALTETMVQLAKGGVGLIISGHAYVTKEGQATPWQLGAYKDELIPGLREMTGAVHDAGGKIVMQLAHSGAFAREKLTGFPPRVVSRVEELTKPEASVFSKDDIQALAASFGGAADRARAAGFDGVQIHSAHGYLLSQFLSPLYNRRTDDYGGDIEHRARVHLEVYREIRNAVGPDFPVMIKMNGRDYVDGGLEVEDSITAGRLLAEAGIDAIELSGGMLNGGALSPSRTVKTEDQEAYFRNEARAFKENIGLPLALVGGIRHFEVAEGLVADGSADYISMSRPLIREPGLIRRWENGDRQISACASDNRCFGPGQRGKGIYCVTAEREIS